MKLPFLYIHVCFVQDKNMYVLFGANEHDAPFTGKTTGYANRELEV